MKAITFVIGTRPEAIKMAPVILKFQESNLIKIRIVLTGQHMEMVNQVMTLFKISSDVNLNLMAPGQSLTHITCETLYGLKNEFQKNRPDLILVQGDTSTAFSSALAGFYEKIPIGHIEAGLRTGCINDPFPEEVNRRLISQLSTLHFAPTKQSIQNLVNSGIKNNLFITGNTVIDALFLIAKTNPTFPLNNFNKEKMKLILVTVHRRENWGEKIKNIAKGIKQLLDNHSDCIVLLPMHKNELVRVPLKEILGNHPRAFLTEPLRYDELVSSIQNCRILLTDSGGLQEEAPALGKPVLVLRETTERPEAINAGTAKLIGTNSKKIYDEANLLLTSDEEYSKMAKSINPFGDGNASGRIFKECMSFINS